MWANIIIIFNLFILEALLSVDNAAVLAVLVKPLPGDDSKKALKWGMWGAYILRGACLFVATYIAQWWWLKLIGGAYLLWMGIGHFTKAADTAEEDVVKGEDSKLYQWLQARGLSRLWTTIILVEFMDLTFSVDNILASVALSNKMWVICLGVFAGIAAMRFVAIWFIELMKKYPSLEGSSFIVIFLLGAKLCISAFAQWLHWESVLSFLENHWTDMGFSACMMLIFFVPLLGKKQEQGPVLDLADTIEDKIKEMTD